MKFNIKIRNFKELLRLIQMEGKGVEGRTYPLVDNCLLVIRDGKIYSNTMAKSSVAIAMLKYKEVDVITPGDLGISNIELFLKYLGRFENDDEVSVELVDGDNRVKITRTEPKKTARIPIIDKQYADDSSRAEGAISKIKEDNGNFSFGKTELNIKLVVDSHYMKQALGDADIENMRRRFPFTVAEDRTFITVGDKISGVIETEIPTLSKTGEGKSTYVEGFDNVFRELKGDVEIFFAEGEPMLVKKYSDKFDIRYVIAPIIPED